MAWERVYTVNDYYHGERLGVADVFGKPHIYESPFDDGKGNFEDFFVVSPIEPELLAVVLEDRDLWIRWFEARGRGETSKEIYPLPDDQARHGELKRLIGTRLKAELVNGRRMKAEFRDLGRDTKVQWSEWVG